MASLPSASGAVTVLPTCWQASSRGQKLELVRGFPSSSSAESKWRGWVMSWSSSRSRHGMHLGSVFSPSSPFTAQRRKAGVVRSEQGEAGTTISAPPLPIELNKGGVTEVDKDTFWPIVASAGEKVVVLDMYTQWCGPCKIMLPKVIELAGKLDDVIFLKLDCNKYNKELAKELGIRVVPTFKIFKHNAVVGEITGAKFQELVAAIDKSRNSETVA